MLPYAPWLCWLIHMIGAALTLILGRVNLKLRNYAAVASVGLSTLFSVSMMSVVFAGNVIDYRVSWLYFEVGVLVDPLSVLMASLVNGIGLLVALFSLEYMRRDPGLSRYWFLIQVFIGGLTLIVVADNLLWLFIGWEIVGLSCSGLIAFWYKDSYKAHRGFRTFMLFRVGDAFLLASIIIIYTYSGTFNLVDLQHNVEWIWELSRSGLLLVTTIMFLAGALAKSALFPFHEWLPDGLFSSPASFNALTEVLAGAFLVIRFLPMFHGALVNGCTELTFFFLTVAWIGALSTVLSSLIAITRRSIIRVLSYSVIGLYAYVMVGLGVGGLMESPSSAYLAANLYLVVDGVITALLFLCAASILYATGSENMFDLGGLKKKIPLTYRSMEIGTLAMMGMIPFSGYWCQNWIQSTTLDLAHQASISGQYVLMVSSYGLFAALLVATVATSFFAFRMIGLIFFGEGVHRSKRRGIKRIPVLMRIPLITAAMAVLILDFSIPFLTPVLNSFFLPLIHEVIFGNFVDVLKYIVLSISTPLSCVALAIGAYPAYQLYIARRIDPIKLIEEHRFLQKAHNFLWNRCYINALYRKVADGTRTLSNVSYRRLELRGIDALNYKIAGSFRRLSRIMYKYPELRGIDALNYKIAGSFRRLSRIMYKYPELRGIDALNYFLASLFTSFCRNFRKTQTGVLSFNMLMAFIGAALLIVLLFLFGGHIP